MKWNNKEVLITGGTGSLGKTLLRILSSEMHPRGVRVFSRDELKQWELQRVCKHEGWERVSFLIGDIRDKERLKIALQGVHIVINAAAMKQVGNCESNPIEAIKTNVFGSQNLLECAIEAKVEKVMHVSTDKACAPINLYGATKLCAEKLFVNGNIYTGGHGTKFSVCRYGNVIGSRGSVIPLWKQQEQDGLPLTLTDKNMTRFFITLEQVARFLLSRIEEMQGGEIFVPRMKTLKMLELAQSIAPNTEIQEIGIQPGEKLHECLITEEESRYVTNMGNYYKIGTVPTGHDPFIYSSDNPSDRMSPYELQAMLRKL